MDCYDRSGLVLKIILLIHVAVWVILVKVAHGYKKILPMTALSVNGLPPARDVCRLMTRKENNTYLIHRFMIGNVKLRLKENSGKNIVII